MAKALDRLRADHENLAKILEVLDKQILSVETCRDIDYDVMRDIIDYFGSRAHQSHRVCEEAIFERLKRNTPGAATIACDLLGAHRKTAMQLQRMSALIDELLTDGDTERKKVASALKVFAASVRQNIRQEEDRFFAAAERALAPSDWIFVDQAERADDPLFESTACPGYLALREEIGRLSERRRAVA